MQQAHSFWWFPIKWCPSFVIISHQGQRVESELELSVGLWCTRRGGTQLALLQQYRFWSTDGSKAWFCQHITAYMIWDTQEAESTVIRCHKYILPGFMAFSCVYLQLWPRALLRPWWTSFELPPALMLAVRKWPKLPAWERMQGDYICFPPADTGLIPSWDILFIF